MTLRTARRRVIGENYPVRAHRPPMSEPVAYPPITTEGLSADEVGGEGDQGAVAVARADQADAERATGQLQERGADGGASGDPGDTGEPEGGLPVGVHGGRGRPDPGRRAGGRRQHQHRVAEQVVELLADRDEGGGGGPVVGSGDAGRRREPLPGGTPQRTAIAPLATRWRTSPCTGMTLRGRRML